MMHKMPSGLFPKRRVSNDSESPTRIRIGPASAEIAVVKKIQTLKAQLRAQALKMKPRFNLSADKSDQEEDMLTYEEKLMAMEEEFDVSTGDENDSSELLQPPKEFQGEFQEQFAYFLDFCKTLGEDLKMQLPSICRETDEAQYYKLKYLMKVYYLSGHSYYEANSLQIWDDIDTILTREEKSIIGDVKAFYQDNLFVFEKFSGSSQTLEDLKDILELDIKKLTDPYILRPPEEGQLTKEFYRDVLDHQAVLLKGFVDHYDVSKKLFSVENIAKTHPNDVIDVVYQNPHLYGFIQDPEATFQYKKQMSIEDYYNYQLESQAHEPQNVTDENGMIKFAVNIDIEEWKDEMQELQTKLPKEFLFTSDQDAMIYSKQKIKGINLPQLYMKVEGAWTGGHEENLRLRAINLNHGPGSSVWFTVDVKHAKVFRQLIKDLYGLDIHKDEGLWFGDIDTCIKNGIEIQYFVQEPGDIVVLGPGCLHWVRCTGIATNSAWNFCSKDKFQFEKGFDRYDINREIDFKSLIPLRHLAKKLLFRESYILPKTLETFLIEKLNSFYDEELELYREFKEKYPDPYFIYENEGNSVFNCVQCNYETLNFYIYCHGCSGKKPDDNSLLICLKCYEAHRLECKKPRQTYYYYKLSPEMIKELRDVLPKLETLKDDYKSLSQYMHRIVTHDRKRKIHEWQKAFEKDEPDEKQDKEEMTKLALKTKVFDKKKQARKLHIHPDKLKELEANREKFRNKMKQKSLTAEKALRNLSLTKNDHQKSEEKIRQNNENTSSSGHKVKPAKGSVGHFNAYEENVKILKELQKKKSSSVTHDPPSGDEETLQEADGPKYRIKKKQKLEGEPIEVQLGSNSVGFSSIGSLFGSPPSVGCVGKIGNTSSLLSGGKNEKIEIKVAYDNHFLGKLSESSKS